jgi:hypothetical protein
VVRTKLRRRLFGIAGSTLVAGSLSAVGLVVASPGPAGADTSPFIAYCPATTIGDIAMSGTVITGTFSPSPVNSGATATIDPHVVVTLPAGLVSAAEGLGNTQIAGYISGGLVVTNGTPATISVGGPSTAPTSVYTGTGSFSAALPTPAAPVTINVDLGPKTVTAGNSGTLSISSQSSLTVFDLVNSGPPATYLPLTCSPVNPTAVASDAYTGTTAGAGIALGSSGPINVPSLSTSLPINTAIMVTDGTNAVLATVNPTAVSSSTSTTAIDVETGAGGAWTAKATVGGTNTVDELVPFEPVIATDTITPVPTGNANPNSVAFLTATASVPISVTGANWEPSQTSSTCTLTWSTGSDAGTCSTDASGNLTGTIDASVAGEQGSNIAPFVDDIVIHADNQVPAATTLSIPVQISPFSALDTFCSPDASGLAALNTPPGPSAPGTPPLNPLTITRGAASDLYTGPPNLTATTPQGGLPVPGSGYSTTSPPTPSVGCDPKQQISAFVLGSSLYIWETGTFPNEFTVPNSTVTSASTTVTTTNVPNFAQSGVYAGIPVSGTGIPAGAVVTSVATSGNSITISAAATTSATETLTFGDGAHVALSPVQLGLDNTFSALGGNLAPCAPPFPGNPACSPAVNNGQFDQALGQLNTVTVQDDRGTLTGWTVTGQLETDFNNLAAHGPAKDNVIPADFLTWDPSVTLTTAGTLPGSNANASPGSPCESGTAIQAVLPGCVVGPSGLPQPVGGGAGVNGTGATGAGGTGGSSSQPAEVNAGLPAPLNNLNGSADVLCATDLSLAGGSAGGGGSFNCNAGLLLAIPPYVASGQYQATMDITILGF